MIENIFGKRKQVICDNCGDGFEAESWEDAQSKMKLDGWATRKKDGVWVNYCGECTKEENHD